MAPKKPKASYCSIRHLQSVSLPLQNYKLSAMATTAPSAAPTSAAASKTPCSFFAQGKCRNGAACNFYHAPREDLAVSPLPCKFFLQNACKAGALVV